MDLVAYDLYVQATSLIDNAGFQEHKEQGNAYFQATELLNQAIGRDSDFLLAYCRLAEANDELYFNDFDHTPERLDLAKSAIDSAFRVKRDSGEAHLARGRHLYHGYFDYDRARDELAIAARTLPNNAQVFEWLGYIDRRQNRWYDAVRNFERAMDLDPRDVQIVNNAAGIYHLLCDYKRERETRDRLIALEPNNSAYRLERARIDLRERADTRAAHAVLEKIPIDNPQLASARFDLALDERDVVAADRALKELSAMGADTFEPGRGGLQFSLDYLQALAAKMRGDAAGALAAFTDARVQQEQAVRARPDSGPLLSGLGVIDAGLGRKEEALREGRRALEITPMKNNPFDAVDVIGSYAMICAWTGERDLAIEQLEALVKMPAGPSYGYLRLDPAWDSLRNDPHFEKILNSLAPK